MISDGTKFIGLASVAFFVAAAAVIMKVDPSTTFGSVAKGLGVYNLSGTCLLLAKASYNCYRDDIGKKVQSFLSFN